MTRYSYNTLSYTLLHKPHAKRGTDFVSIVLVLQFFLLSVFSSSLVSSEVTMINSNATSKFPQQHSDDGVKTLSKLLPVAIVIVLANGLVFVLFYRCRRLRTSSSFCDFAKRIELWDILLAYITSFFWCLSHTCYYCPQVLGNCSSTKTPRGN